MFLYENPPAAVKPAGFILQGKQERRWPHHLHSEFRYLI